MAFVVVLAVAQHEGDGVLGGTSAFYRSGFGHLALSDFAVFLLLSIWIADPRSRSRLGQLPAPVIGASVLLVAAAILGAFTGLSQGARPSAAIDGARCTLYLGLVPLLVACIMGPQVEMLLRALVVGASIVLAIGLLGFVTGRGPVLATGEKLTYFEAAPLWWSLVVVLALAAGLRTSRPWIDVAIALASLLVLILSLRRGFIVATAVTLPLAAIASIGKGRRSVFVLATAVVAIGVVLAALVVPSGSAVTDVPGARAVEDLQATRSTGDEYRVAERRNVLRNIGSSPLYGIGFGMRWRLYEPLPADFRGYQDYVHIAALWYWLKMGVLGLVAYLAWLVAAAWAGLRAWRRSAARPLRAFGLASGLGIVGLAIVETTATQTGVDARLACLVAICIGITIAPGHGSGATFS